MGTLLAIEYNYTFEILSLLISLPHLEGDTPKKSLWLKSAILAALL
jgi:hypothetical protein